MVRRNEVEAELSIQIEKKAEIKDPPPESRIYSENGDKTKTNTH